MRYGIDDTGLKNKIMAFCLTVLTVGTLMLGMPAQVQAECRDMPETVGPSNGNGAKGCDFPNCVWKSPAVDKEFAPTLEWDGTQTGRKAVRFRLVPFEGGAVTPTTWPYRLPNLGLYIAITGHFKFRAPDGVEHTFEIVDPRYEIGNVFYEFEVRTPIEKAVISFEGMGSTFTPYIMSENNGSTDGSLANVNLPLGMTVVGLDENGQVIKSAVVTNSGVNTFICANNKTISLITPCSIKAFPSSIDFGTMRAKDIGSVGRLIKTDKSRVDVVCGQSSKSSVRLQALPAMNPIDSERKIAPFSRVDGSSGERFKGLGLVYKIVQPDEDGIKSGADCSDGDVWGKAKEMESAKNGEPVSADVHWGLCRIDEELDTGTFATTAVIQYWIN